MKNFLLLIFISLSFLGFTQRNLKENSVSTFLIGAHYAPSFALKDLATRYNFLNHIGASVSYKTAPNWVFGVEGSFIFGNYTRMKGLFDHLVDSQGNISDANGDVGVVLANPRGLNFNVNVGKIIPIAKSNPNSGIFIRISGGYLQHKLNVETRDHVIPSLELKYKKGYDRLSTGFASEQFLGYLYMGNNEYANFLVGGFIQEGFTKNRRNLNYDQPDVPVDKSLRLDIMVGLKLSWLIPAYSRKSKTYYFD